MIDKLVASSVVASVRPANPTQRRTTDDGRTQQRQKGLTNQAKTD
ncbi:MAG: hypothetical protein WC895_04890 [Candidatus Shapirobacteria bacterium]